MELPNGKKIYFSSDNHLGAPNAESSITRERVFISWLNDIKKDVGQLFLLGDLFDFWFEYKTVVPKGFVRVLGKLAELSDQGVEIHFFVGNHDLWVLDYFEKELGFNVHKEPKEFNINGKKFFIGHGDGLGPKDLGFKRMKKVFTAPIFQWLYRWIHPDIGIKIGQYLSLKNKMISGDDDIVFLGEEKEWLVQYCHKKQAEEKRDFYVFGHRHLPLDIAITSEARYLNLGDWITHFTYAEFDGRDLELKTWDS
ncbi:MAG: UDP-2,3-diacylglucosamine diphosphatase [Flavobacteriaceae bacterium]|nr:UDP-2,3-diacylglucosamine diphosphatase [Flavobacteriaceae bacterium]